VRTLAAAALLAALLTAGCGDITPPDLFVASRSGSIPGAALHMRVTDDGLVYCGSRKHEVSSHELILARVLANDLSKPAKQKLSLPPGHPSILRFGIRTQDGTVAFSDTSAHQPAVFFRAAELIRTIAIHDCGLPR
jgi:hypothetical protein